MSTRLTKSIRESITKDLLRHRFEEDAKKTIDAFADHAIAIYEDVYSKKKRDLMSSLPNGWLCEARSIGARIGVSYVHVHFMGSHAHSAVRDVTDYLRDDRRRVPYKDVSGCLGNYPVGHPMHEQYEALVNRQSQLVQDIREAKQKIEASLASVTTIKRLIEEWPEVATFATRHENAPDNLPAIPTTAMNEILGLPVSEAA